MDNNNFKQSKDFSNIESNKHHNPANHSESYRQQVTDYINDMRSQNKTADREGFLKNAQRTAQEQWNELRESAEKAWDDHSSENPE